MIKYIFTALALFSSTLMASDDLSENQTKIVNYINNNSKKIHKNWSITPTAKEREIDSSDFELQIVIHEKDNKETVVHTLVYTGENKISDYTTALEKLPKTTIKGECGLFSKILNVLVQGETMGTKKFQKYLGDILEKNKELCTDGVNSGILFEILAGELGLDYINNSLSLSYRNEPKIGDFVYIANIEDYLNIKENGTSQGENVVCIGKNEKNDLLYFGFNTIFQNGAKTEFEIYNAFYEELKDDEDFKKKYTSKIPFIKECQKRTKKYGKVSIN